MEKKLNDLIDKALSRRSFLAGAGTVAAGSVLTGCFDSNPPPYAAPVTTTTTPPTFIDSDYVQFALNLEYLEAEYYLYAATGSGLSSTDAGTGAGTTKVPSVTQVQFTAGSALQQYANEIAQDELNHVRFLRSTLTSLGVTPVSRPALDLTFFAGLATAAGISGTFNPFADPVSFLIGAFVFEDVGVTAYHGAAGALSTTTTGKTILGAAASIMAVEAYHAAEIRTIIAANAAAGTTVTTPVSYASALIICEPVSTLRGKISAASGNMIAAETTVSTGSIVAADSNAIAYARLPDRSSTSSTAAPRASESNPAASSPAASTATSAQPQPKDGTSWQLKRHRYSTTSSFAAGARCSRSAPPLSPVSPSLA